MKETSYKRLKTLGGSLLGIILAAGIGFAVGYISTSWFPEASAGEAFWVIPAIFFFTFLGYFIHIIIHEAGHLVFGLLSSYQFSSFRVGNAVLFKRDGKFKRGKYSIPGTGGQCLMGPPAYNGGDFPFVLYNLGGVLMNLIATGVFVLLLFGSFPVLVNLVLIGFILGGLLTAVTNGIPMTISGIPNDAQNIRVMKEDETLRYSFWFQLHANQVLTQGVRPRELPIDKLAGLAETNLDQPLNTAIHFIRYNYYLDQQDFVQAKRVLEDFAPYERNMMPLYRNELQFERLFLELIGANRDEVVESLYTEELLKHAKVAKNWPNHKRTLMAYEWFHNGDKSKAMGHLEYLRDVAKTHPVLGEVKMELALVDYISKDIDAQDD